MNKLAIVISFCLLALSSCKKNMPAVVAPRWHAIEELARTAGSTCDRVLALSKCPLEPDGLPHSEAGPEAKLPVSPLVGAAEVREVEVLCEARAISDESARMCYLASYFDPKAPQRGASWMCGRNKPYPGWENSKDGLALAYEDGCKENLYHAWMRRKTPAGNTVQAAVYFYVDGHAPTTTAAPQPR